MNWIVALAAIVTAADLPQRVALLRDYSRVQRTAVAAGTVAALLAVAFVATPVLRALDISAPNLQIGAGIVLGLWSIAAFFRWVDEPSPSPAAAGLVPGLFPVVLTPCLGVVTAAVAARNGVVVPIVGAAIAAAFVGAATELAPAVGRRPARLASATAGVVLAVAVLVDGVFAI